MLDPKLLRESPDIVRAAIAKKHLDVDLDAVLALDTQWRAQLAEVEVLRAKQKAANNEMAALKKGSPEFIAKVQEMKAVSAQVKEKEVQLTDTESKWRMAMLKVPNIPHASAPGTAAVVPLPFVVYDSLTVVLDRGVPCPDWLGTYVSVSVSC